MAPRGLLVGVSVSFAPPLAFAAGLLALAGDRTRPWARTGLIVSFLTFALWLTWLIVIRHGRFL